MFIQVELSKEGNALLNQVISSNFIRMIVNADGTSKKSINKVNGYISSEVKLLVEVKIGDYIFDKRRDNTKGMVYDVFQIVEISTDIVPAVNIQLLETIRCKEIAQYLGFLRNKDK